MKIQKYKCRFTGEEFTIEEKSEYIKHLKELRKEMSAQRTYNERKTAYDLWLESEKKSIVEIDQIIPWIFKNQKKLMGGCNDFYNHYRSFNDKFDPKTDKFEKIEFSNLRYDKCVSNSHTCPKTGTTNWEGYKTGVPRGYPGFTCYLKTTLKRLPKNKGNYPTAGLFNHIGIYTGTGGGGNENGGWGVEIFLDDWPGIKETVERNQIIDKLNGKI